VEQYEKLKTDEWNATEEDHSVKSGFMAKLGIKKKIGVIDWLDLFSVLSELLLHCGEDIAKKEWNNDGIFDLLQVRSSANASISFG